MSLVSIKCVRCGEPMDDDPDAQEGELCCACETDDIHRQMGKPETAGNHHPLRISPPGAGCEGGQA
jgi:hypothetical protein